MSKHLTIVELDALILDAEEERDEAQALGAQWWASTADHIIKTLCRFQTQPHIESELVMTDHDVRDGTFAASASVTVDTARFLEFAGFSLPVSGDLTAKARAAGEPTC